MSTYNNFLFIEIFCIFQEMTSSALIDGGIFEEFEFTDEQNLTEQYHTWPDIQSGFPQAQLTEHHYKSTQHTLVRSCSLEEHPRNLLPHWLSQGNDFPEELISFNGPTIFDS